MSTVDNATVMANECTPGSTESTDRLVEKVRYIEDSSFDQSESDPPDSVITQGGFECQFVEKPPENAQFECPVCQLVLREPYVVDCCGQNFCRTCIKRIQADEKPCPTCNKAGFSTISDQKLQRLLYPLHVQCSHEKEGCQWTGKLGELDKHLNKNPKPDEQLLGCEYAKIGCIHCSEFFLRPSITTHQDEECPQRPFSCVYCRDYKSSYEDVVNSHWQVCSCYPVSCPNQCGAEPERDNLEDHVSNDCPLTVFNCSFRYVGCEVELPRKDMPVHVTENLVLHMSLLAVQSQKTAKENVELKEELADSRKQLEIQSQKTSKENLEIKEELADLRQQLKKQHREKEQQKRVFGVVELISVAVVVLVIVLAHIWQTIDHDKQAESVYQRFKEEEKQFEHKIKKRLEEIKQLSLDLSQQIHENEHKIERLWEEIERLELDLIQQIHGNEHKIERLWEEIEQLELDLIQQIHGNEHKIEKLGKEIEQLKEDLLVEVMEAIKRYVHSWTRWGYSLQTDLATKEI